ncbi:hypothetical protein E3N88_00861 [Mikania micrantha]|uniref:Uncharacterized protein n=1 Tax=Mikania micrantha TaxID=192012 RepID=A0A5N6PZC9_9ASTR|nr:hypothetical protein E3N88_00861 [Mikania micrantha]
MELLVVVLSLPRASYSPVAAFAFPPNTSPPGIKKTEDPHAQASFLAFLMAKSFLSFLFYCLRPALLKRDASPSIPRARPLHLTPFMDLGCVGYSKPKGNDSVFAFIYWEKKITKEEMDEGLERENHAPISKFKSAPLKWHLKVAPVKKLSSKSLKRSLDLHSSAHSQLLLLIPTAGGYARPASSSGGRSQVVNAGQVGTTSWLRISCYELIQILIFLLSVVTTYCYFIHPNFAGTSLSELGTKLIDLAIDMRLKMNRSRNLVNEALIKIA